jgi:hypothetical protein
LTFPLTKVPAPKHYNQHPVLNTPFLGLLRIDEGVGFLEQLQKLRVEGEALHH